MRKADHSNAKYRPTYPRYSPSDQSIVRPPLGVATVDVIRCTEVYGTRYPRDGELLGYAIQFSGKHDAYGRSADGSLIHFGTFDRHEDALETVFRSV